MAELNDSGCFLVPKHEAPVVGGCRVRNKAPEFTGELSKAEKPNRPPFPCELRTLWVWVQIKHWNLT